MARLSVVINVVDSEVEFLHRVLESVKNLADEIVLVDMTSSDKVKELALEYEAKVEKHEFLEYVEPVRNFGISKAGSEWLLILDPDEELPEELKKRIGEILANPDSAAYYRLPRKNVIFGKWIRHARWWPDYNIRLFKKGYVVWNEIIHSVPMTKGEGADLPADEVLAIVHYHYNSVEQYLERLNRYTTQHARLLIKGGYQFDWKDLIEKPVNEFLSRYFFGKGYTDGLHGLALSMLQAVSELVTYLKVWQAAKFKETGISVENVVGVMKKSQKDINYWEADALYRKGGGLLQKVKRRLKLP